MLLGSFRTIQHQVRGEVYAIDERTIRVENFRYDGSGIGKLKSQCLFQSVSRGVKFPLPRESAQVTPSIEPDMFACFSRAPPILLSRALVRRS